MDDFTEKWMTAEARHAESLGLRPPGVEGRWEVDFALGGKVKTFHRDDPDRGSAIESAKHGFQWTYGFWPGDPIAVREGGGS